MTGIAYYAASSITMPKLWFARRKIADSAAAAERREQRGCIRGLCCASCVKKKKCPLSKQTLKIFLVAFVTLLSSEFATAMVFPFLPFMVKFLLPHIDDASVGKYAGIIASSIFVGRVFGSYVWGAISDTVGRKPVLIVSGLLMGLSSAAFGFSVNFAMAVLMRFLVGLTNGVVAAAKAIVAEVSDDSTQAYGISILSSSWSLGLIIGPAVAGAIVDPIGQYNLTISNPTIRGFLTKFPFSLPCLVNLLIAIVGVLGVAFFLPETLNKKNDQNAKRETCKKQRRKVREHTLRTEAHAALDTNSCEVSSNVTVEESVADFDDSDTCRLVAEVHQNPEATNGSKSERPSTVSIDRSSESTSDFSAENSLVCLNSPESDALQSTRELAVEGVSVVMESINRATDLVSENDQEAEAKAPKVSRRTSLLIPYFNRTNSFTLSFVKVSRATLQKFKKPFTKDGELLEEDEESENPVTLQSGSKLLSTSSWMKRKGKSCRESVKKSLLNLKLFLCDRVILLSLLIYCVFSFAFIGLDELYPLWASAPPHLGGLGFTQYQIGISLAIAGVGMLPFSLFSFPILERRFLAINTFQMNAIPLTFAIILLPNVHFLVRSGQTALVWLLLCIGLLSVRATLPVAWSSIALFINNSVTFDKLGSVNGLAATMVAMFRSISPVVVGFVFSASLSEETRSIGFPVNYHLVFIILGLVILISSFMVACLPESINRQKVANGVEQKSKDQNDSNELEEVKVIGANTESTV